LNTHQISEIFLNKIISVKNASSCNRLLTEIKTEETETKRSATKPFSDLFPALPYCPCGIWPGFAGGGVSDKSCTSISNTSISSGFTFGGLPCCP
jgi:hypothetical protein